MRLTGTCNWGNPLSRKWAPEENSGWEMMLIGSSRSQVRAYGGNARLDVLLDKEEEKELKAFWDPGFNKTWAHFALVYSGSTAWDVPSPAEIFGCRCDQGAESPAHWKFRRTRIAEADPPVP